MAAQAQATQEPNVFDPMGQTVDVNESLQLETGADFRGILQNLGAEPSAADRYDSATDRVNLYMKTFQSPMVLSQRKTGGVEDVMSADQILDLYKLHTHSTYSSNVQDARLQYLQTQANRDKKTSHQTGVSSFITRLLQDMNRIRCSSLSDFFSQLGRVLSSDNRPFAFGMFFVFVGLLSMALSRVEKP